MVAASGRRCGRVRQHLEAVRLRHEALSQPRIIGKTTRNGLWTDPRPLCLLFLIGGIVLLCGLRPLEEDSNSTLLRLGYDMLTRNDDKTRCSHAPTRQRPSIDKVIPTRYGRAQRKRRRVRKRRESITTQFNRLFKVVLDRRTSTATRTALVRALIPLAHRHEESALDSHQCPKFRKNVHPTKALRFAVRKSLDSMADEHNPKVRSFLLRLLAVPNFFSVWTYADNTGTDQKTIFEVLEQAHITEHEKFFALSGYFKYGKEKEPFGTEELASQMIHMCIRTIRQDNGRITDPALKCLLHEIRHRRDDSDIHYIVRDEIVMRTVFGGISPSSKDYKMKLHSKLLLQLLNRARVADRAYLLTEYASQLEQALSILPIYHYENFELLRHADIVNLLVNIKFFMSEMAYMLYYWRDAVRKSFNGNDPSIYQRIYAQYCRAARRVLSAMEGNDEKLQEILGYGFLPGAASFSAQVDPSGADPSVMQLYRRILDVYPEWTRGFCDAVRRGEIANALTMLGRNLERVEKKTRAAYYYLVEPQIASSDQDENPVTDEPPTTQPITIVLRNKDAEPEFSNLPMHFLVQVARTMTLKELGHFRLTCKKAFEAVTEVLGGSRRTLEIKRLVRDLWTKRVHFTDDPYFHSLHGVQKQVAIFAGWLGHDEIGSIDFRGVDTMSCAQLEACFGTEPRPSVKQLNVVGTVVMPTVWSTLARLFPSVTIVHCTENACRFLDSIVREEGDTIGGCALKDSKQLEESGRLDEQRIAILRSLRSLFSDAQCIYIE